MTSYRFNPRRPARAVVLVPREFVITSNLMGPFQTSEWRDHQDTDIALTADHEAAGWRVLSFVQDDD